MLRATAMVRKVCSGWRVNILSLPASSRGQIVRNERAVVAEVSSVLDFEADVRYSRKTFYFITLGGYFLAVGGTHDEEDMNSQISFGWR